MIKYKGIKNLPNTETMRTAEAMIVNSPQSFMIKFSGSEKERSDFANSVPTAFRPSPIYHCLYQQFPPSLAHFSLSTPPRLISPHRQNIKKRQAVVGQAKSTEGGVRTGSVAKNI